MLAVAFVSSDWNNLNGEGTLAEMGRDEIEVKVDVEEGEISDSASVEEISEEDFNKQEVRILKESKSNGDSNSRVWTMRDLYNKYPSICRGYASGLYNLAWAQAVQNKPLNFGVEVEKDENSKRSSPSASVASVNDKTAEMDSAKEVENVVIDDSGDEKEEGELEEGEIDIDCESAEKVKVEAAVEVLSGGGNLPTAEVDLSKQVSSIRGVLEGVTASEAEKSFEEVCSKLENTLPKLRDLIVDNEMAILTDPALIKLAFGAINSVFFYVNSRPDELNKGILSRLLSSISGYKPSLFSLDHKKEIERMRFSLESSTRTSDKEEKKITDGLGRKDSYSSSESMGNASVLVEPILHNKSNTLNSTTQPGMSGFRTRGVLLPLLDLHKDHDADSLPSPTREMTPPVFAHKSSPVGDGVLKSSPVVNNAIHGAVDTKVHPYETDALKAVSTYQQKFGRGSMLFDELPSPTPSEESGGEGGDTGGEVSSSLIGVVKPCPAVTVQPIVSTPSQASTTNFGMQGQTVVQNASPLNSGPTAPSKSSAKSRDPRLRFAFADAGSFDASQRPIHNAPKSELVSGLLNSRKQKNTDEPALDGPVLKKQKNELEDSKLGRNVPSISGSGGWLEGNDAVGTHITNRTQPLNSTELHSRNVDNATPFTNIINGRTHMSSCGNEQGPIMTTSTLTSLPALLKDIAVNPTMLLNLLKMSQQQKSASETQQSSAESGKSAARNPSSNTALGAVPSVSFTPVNPGNLHKPVGSVQIPSHPLPADDSGKIRMKPRDPRHILHGNMLQRSGNSGIDQFKSNCLPALSTLGSNDIVNAEKTDIQPPKHLQSPAAPSPNIARQFTKNLKNIAEILSLSQTSTAPQAAPANEALPTVHKEDHNAVAVQAPEVGTLLPRSPNVWGNVDDLFEGYDDKQKAAIQSERARRIEEQRKMFASQKLCLVLDLDHTLLNSAKFHEVDSVHQDILRKKEEQDREKSQRHLFRFPHMGMWTKLRPGIWNFLEKATKLYELHLYTMGNKLYATEMAKVLDPKGVLFSGRVISRGDDGDPFDGDERVPKSKDLEGVLGMESAVVIIDDSLRVWPHNKLNLIVVERYTYFPCSRRQFGLLGPSLLEIDHDERPEDGTLASSLAVIERIHQNFFSNQNLDEVDVRNILASEQRKILAGCKIVFSRVFPVGEANPHLHPLWQTAEQFGATCTNQIDEQVTHVVANSLGTDKVNWALSTGRFVVHPGWVEASALLYRRANELDFAIKP